MEYKWSNAMVKHLIENFQQHPCLYEISSKAYLDRNLKDKALNDITEKLKRFKGDLKVEDVRKKLTNMRTTYVREHRLANASKKSGSGSNDVLYVPKLWYYDQLGFLQQHIKARESSNIETQADESDSCSAFLLPTPKRAKVSQISSHLTRLNGLIKSRQQKNSKHEWLTKLVEAKMDMIDEEDQESAGWDIQCILKKYTDNARRKREMSSSRRSTTERVNTWKIESAERFGSIDKRPCGSNALPTRTCGLIEVTMDITNSYTLKCMHCVEKFFIMHWASFLVHMEEKHSTFEQDTINAYDLENFNTFVDKENGCLTIKLTDEQDKITLQPESTISKDTILAHEVEAIKTEPDLSYYKVENNAIDSDIKTLGGAEQMRVNEGINVEIDDKNIKIQDFVDL